MQPNKLNLAAKKTADTSAQFQKYWQTHTYMVYCGADLRNSNKTRNITKLLKSRSIADQKFRNEISCSVKGFMFIFGCHTSQLFPIGFTLSPFEHNTPEIQTLLTYKYTWLVYK